MKKTLFMVLMLSAVSVFGAERTYRKEFPVTAGARFSLDSYKGFIKIRTDSVPSIRVSARIYPDQGADPALVEYTRIREQSGSGFVSLEVEFDSDAARADRLVSESETWPLVDWDITLPDDARVRLETYKSEVDIHAPAGDFDIESYKGHGRITGIRNRFSIDTYKGEFEVEILKLADVQVDTYKGEVRLEIRGGGNMDLQAHTRRGDLRFDGLGVEVNKERHETTAVYRSGNGTNRIDLETDKGTIHLRFIQ